MLQKDTFAYVVNLRRELHQCPEIGFDLPQTLAVVHRELDKMGIPYTGEFGKSSVVATINPDCKGTTIGIRGDMDALPIQEVSDKEYCSKIPGAMHACGHDAHTAMLLGTAKALKALEKELKCRVLLVFQACEEGSLSGAREMVEDGLMEEIDTIITQCCPLKGTAVAGELFCGKFELNATALRRYGIERLQILAGAEMLP